MSAGIVARGDTMCSGPGASVMLDLATGVRTAAANETIRYSTAWVDSAASDAMAVVAVNGEILNSATGAGYVDWAPSSNGTYTLTHKVTSSGSQVGETLTAMFVVDWILTSTQTTVVPVPYVWLRQYVPGDAGGRRRMATGDGREQGGDAVLQG